MIPQIDFRSVRPHRDSRNRGFEELCYQLIPLLRPFVEGTRVLRFGTPDGGVEALSILPDGTTHGWQAKYFDSLQSAQFQQMDKSVQEALEKHPEIRRYTFCIPSERSVTAKGRQKSGMQRWKDYVAKWENDAKAKNMHVEFDFAGESDLLNALTAPNQAGRVLYWFSTTILTPEWFEHAVDLALISAGPRYTPELRIDVPIAPVFQGLARSEEFEQRIRAEIRNLRSTRKWWDIDQILKDHDADLVARLRPTNELVDEVQESALQLRIPGTTPLPFEDLIKRCNRASNAAWNLADEFVRRAYDTNKEGSQADDGSSGIARALSQARDSIAWNLRRTAKAVDEIRDLAESPAGRLVNLPALLVSGGPGSGKTHLFCDVAKQRAEEHLPTIILLGQRFDRSEPWRQLLDQLLLNCSVDEFLGALSAAAEANNERAFIMIDAINEGEGPSIWPDYLMSFVEKLKQWPRVGLALSCRTSYVKATMPRGLDERFVRVEHTGFEGVEYPAMRAFFKHYKLTLPDFPLLVPEFQNPLFLKLMCEGLNQKGMSTIPRGSSGISWLFDLFLGAVEDRLAKPDRSDYNPTDLLVKKATQEIAREMLLQGSDCVKLTSARSLCDALLPNRGWEKSLFQGLFREGVLTQDLLEVDGSHEEIVSFAYQRFGDHLRALEICDKYPTIAQIKEYCSSVTADWGTAWRNSGLIHALAVLVPEHFSSEFHQFVKDELMEPVADAYLESLIWRDPSAFPKPLNLSYLNKINFYRVIDTLLHTACVPEHPFNARILHATLSKQSMNDRDSWWGVYLHRNYHEGTPVARLIDWAWGEDTSHCADDAILLCATALAWYLTSSNRIVRDTSTKALVSLLQNRPAVVVQMLRRFRRVNDPYLLERLYAVAYGCTLVSSDLAGIRRVAKTVYKQAFSEGLAPAHALMRDYARGTLERAYNLGAWRDNVAISKARPPYGSSWPLKAPSEAALETRYHDDKNWYPLWGSVMSSMGDFHRYVIEMAVSRFVPRQPAKSHRLRPRRGRNLLRGVESYDTNLAARWIFNRVVALGWTPERFGDIDAELGYYYPRMEHQAERIGKKYQWIAFHELLAHIADHWRVSEWGDPPIDYDGPWQVSTRDIDPSLLLRSTKSTRWGEQNTTWWSSVGPNVQERFSREEREKWVADDQDLPDAAKLISVVDPSEKRWLMLEGHYEWQEKTPPDIDRYQVDRCTLWYQIRSYLVNASDCEEFVRWANEQSWIGRWMPEADSAGDSFIGEYPWHPSSQAARSR